MAHFPARLIAVLVVLAAATVCSGAPKAAVNPAGLFLSSALRKPTYYYPGFTFSKPSCAPRTDPGALSFKVDLKGGSVILDYLYSPNYFNDGLPNSFAGLTGIALNTRTGALTLKGYGLTLTIDLRTYLSSDPLQKQNRCMNRATKALARNSNLYNYAKKKWSPALSQTDSIIKGAINVLIDTAKYFSQAQPKCSTPDAQNGDASLAYWVQWLVKVNALVGGPMTAAGC